MNYKRIIYILNIKRQKNKINVAKCSESLSSYKRNLNKLDSILKSQYHGFFLSGAHLKMINIFFENSLHAKSELLEKIKFTQNDLKRFEQKEKIFEKIVEKVNAAQRSHIIRRENKNN